MSLGIFLYNSIANSQTGVAPSESLIVLIGNIPKRVLEIIPYKI